MDLNGGNIIEDVGQVLEEFKRNVREELELCDPHETPHVCANLGATDQFQRIDWVIIQKVLKQRITIGEAIVELENELNPNAYGA